MALTKRDLNLINDLFDAKFDEKFDKKFAIVRSQIKSDVYDLIDPIMKELAAIRESQEILTPKIYSLQERIENLEEIHPQGVHA